MKIRSLMAPTRSFILKMVHNTTKYLWIAIFWKIDVWHFFKIENSENWCLTKFQYFQFNPLLFSIVSQILLENKTFEFH